MQLVKLSLNDGVDFYCPATRSQILSSAFSVTPSPATLFIYNDYAPGFDFANSWTEEIFKPYRDPKYHKAKFSDYDYHSFIYALREILKEDRNNNYVCFYIGESMYGLYVCIDMDYNFNKMETD